MNDRVQIYDIANHPERACYTLSDMISHLEIDLYIMRVNCAPFPADIQRRLRGLQMVIENLSYEKTDDWEGD